MRFEVVEFNTGRWADVKAIRQVVFVEEQACPPEEEWDAFDRTSRHLLGLADDGRPLATARWRLVEHEGSPHAKLERFAVLRQARGTGLGRAIVGHTLEDALSAGHEAFILHAQAHLQAFYESFGFVAGGERFMEAGIPHVTMTMTRGR